MMAFSPIYQGALDLEAVPEDFIDRMARRIKTGLLVPGKLSRAHYVVREQSPQAISFAASDVGTALAIGLNEVEVRREGPRRIAYRGSFWRWATYSAVYSFALSALILGLALVLPDLRGEVDRNPVGWPFFLVLLAFFGLVFPWVLVAVHRQVVPRNLERIVREVASHPG